MIQKDLDTLILDENKLQSAGVWYIMSTTASIVSIIRLIILQDLNLHMKVSLLWP